MRIEPPTPADAAALYALHRRILQEGLWFVTEVDELRSDVAQKVQLIRDSARSDNSVLLVAREGPRVLGAVQIAGGALRRVRHVGRLEVMVDEPARGRGVGRALVSAALDWARANPVLEKVGLTVFPHNEAALAVYRELGFVEEGRRIAEYRFGEGDYRDEIAMAVRVNG